MTRTAIPVSANATSGLPVVLTADPSSALTGASLYLAAPGSVQVSGNEPGDAAWLPAPSGSVSLQILANSNIWPAWRQTYFDQPEPTGPAANEEDPDGDGLTNLVEFAIGTSPVGGGDSPALRIDPLTVALEYSRNLDAMAAGVTTAVEWSDTMAPGSWSSQGLTETVLDTTDNVQKVRVGLPQPAPLRRFARLRVTVAP